ncbi:alpha/beta hydrolase [Kribbella sp. NBC_00382]|uniref:alpha/beta fold hydrolase n=1 Tax=Kribbella sp. NBC_00382 TaxID=2975967 RepID=UPI002E24C6E3
MHDHRTGPPARSPSQGTLEQLLLNTPTSKPPASGHPARFHPLMLPHPHPSANQSRLAGVRHCVLLNRLAWGAGDKIAVLVHGMLGSARQFHELGPALAGRGYRAIGVDLPGHGRSPATADPTIESYAESVAETVRAELDTRAAPGPVVELAIGHSLGAIVLAAALPLLRPARAVYVDVPFSPADTGAGADELLARFSGAKAGRTVEQLRVSKPAWSEEDRRVEAEAARQFDPATAVALQLRYDRNPLPGPPSTSIPSVLIRAEPSRFVSPERAGELKGLGFRVRSVVAAGHCVWYGRVDEFLGAVLD